MFSAIGQADVETLRGAHCLFQCSRINYRTFSRPPDHLVQRKKIHGETPLCHTSFLLHTDALHQMAHTLSLISDFLTRRVLARLLSTLLCCIVLVIKPWSRFGGHNAFLLLTLKELVFSAQETLAQHLEATILNITGAFFGIGLSTLARYLASLLPDNSAASRTIPALFLVGITFFGV